jgi:hypothetical protein
MFHTVRFQMSSQATSDCELWGSAFDTLGWKQQSSTRKYLKILNLPPACAVLKGP